MSNMTEGLLASTPMTPSIWTREDELLLVAKLLAADALSGDLEPVQSLGDLLHKLMPEALDLPPYEGFSNYSFETCHESIQGQNTCTQLISRDGFCLGRADSPISICVR